MSDNSVRDAGRSLIKMIWDGVSNDTAWRESVGLESDAQIVLSSPEIAKEDHKLSLFLYRVEEDTYLRSPDWIEAEGYTGDMPFKTRFIGPPASLKLFYMVTPLAKDDETNHLIIGKVIRIFNDNPVLRDPSLIGSLAGSEIKLISIAMSIDDINKIWSILSKSKSYMPSLYYEISGINIESSRVTEVSRVVEIKKAYSKMVVGNGR